MSFPNTILQLQSHDLEETFKLQHEYAKNSLTPLATSKRERTLFRKIRHLHNPRNPRINIFLSGKIQQSLMTSQKTPWCHDLKKRNKKRRNTHTQKTNRMMSLSFVANIPGNLLVFRNYTAFS